MLPPLARIYRPLTWMIALSGSLATGIIPAAAQDIPQGCEVAPVRGDDALFVAWSTNLISPELEIDVPSYGDTIEVEFLLELFTGVQSWKIRLPLNPRTTEVIVPIPPAADLTLLDEPGMLTALAWHYNAAGETIYSHSAGAIPVTLSAGVFTHRAVVPVRTLQVEIDGLLIEFFDRGEVGTVEEIQGQRQPPADEVEVDRED